MYCVQINIIIISITKIHAPYQYTYPYYEQTKFQNSNNPLSFYINSIVSSISEILYINPTLLSCAIPIMVSSSNLTRFNRPEVPPSNPIISSRVITQSIIVLGTFAGVRYYEISSISATCSIFWLVVIFLIITWSVIYISADKKLLKFSSAPPPKFTADFWRQRPHNQTVWSSWPYKQ